MSPKMWTHRRMFFAFILISLSIVIFIMMRDNAVAFRNTMHMDYEINQAQHSGVADEEPLSDIDVVNQVHCSPRERAKSMRDACTNIPTQRGKIIPWVLIDNVHKCVYILVPKAGTRSILTFFSNLMNKKQKVNMKSNREMFARLGLNYTTHITVEEVNDRYANFVKFFAVRHPLQRYVSGYYEIFVRRESVKVEALKWCKKVRRYFDTPSKSCDDHALSFMEFAKAFAKGLLQENHHYAPCLNTIHYCDVNVDIIIKTETMYDDINELKRIIHVNQDVTMTHCHQNAMASHTTSDDIHRYDAMLAELQLKEPSAFQWLLRYVEKDMKAFGYTWNSKTRTSGCSGNDRKCCLHAAYTSDNATCHHI